jgi:antitoxin VapB
MTISIKHPEADQLAREVARNMGGTVTQAVIEALREKRERQERRRRGQRGQRLERMMEIARSCAALPVYDNRTDDELLGYDENGLPT